jgi:hypothetical protein
MLARLETKRGPGYAPETLPARYAAIHHAAVGQLRRTVALENHWLIYVLLGWEHLAACAATHYLVAVLELQRPYRWPYLVVWAAWVLVAGLTVWLVRRPCPGEPSPLAAKLRRVWLVYFLLCGNVVGLNVTAGLPVFVFLPVLHTLGTFAFSLMTVLLSARFLSASLFLFVTGFLSARFPEYGFLIYGISWLVLLETLGLVLQRDRQALVRKSAALPGHFAAQPQGPGILAGQGSGRGILNGHAD